jgi:exopolysaccharide production protein ExoQ
MDTLFKRRWTRWAVWWLLLCQIQALSIIDRVFLGAWLGKGGDKFTEFTNISQIIVSIILFAVGSRRKPGLQRGGILSLSLAVFLLCSAAWSVDAGATVRGGIQYFFFMLGLIGATENLEGDDFMDLLASVCFLSAVASLILFFIAPGYVIGEQTGEFRGVFSQKNVLGQAMAVGALACLHSLRVGKRSWLSGGFMFFVITYAAIKSASTTSSLAILLFCVLGAVTSLLQSGGAGRILGVVLLTLLLLIAPVAAISPDSLYELIGKDPTLTGRTDIWGYVIPYINQRPLLGWGYGAFWSTGNPAAWEIANTIHWYAPEAHNGLLEILLSGGLVGAVWFIYLWVRTFRLSLRCIRYDSAMAITCFSICAGILLEGVSEQVLLYVDGLSVVFFISGFFCEQAVSRARRRRPTGVGNVVKARSTHVASSPSAGLTR